MISDDSAPHPAGCNEKYCPPAVQLRIQRIEDPIGNGSTEHRGGDRSAIHTQFVDSPCQLLQCSRHMRQRQGRQRPEPPRVLTRELRVLVVDKTGARHRRRLILEMRRCRCRGKDLQVNPRLIHQRETPIQIVTRGPCAESTMDIGAGTPVAVQQRKILVGPQVSVNVDAHTCHASTGTPVASGVSNSANIPTPSRVKMDSAWN